jgi:hypothetical protein
MQHLRQLQIGDELAAPGQQAPIFASRYGAANERRVRNIVHSADVGLIATIRDTEISLPRPPHAVYNDSLHPMVDVTSESLLRATLPLSGA